MLRYLGSRDAHRYSIDRTASVTDSNTTILVNALRDAIQQG
jgi:hypothetical protein